MIDLAGFQSELEAESLPFQKMFREVVPYFSAELMTRVLDRTPVDTGHLKESWKLDAVELINEAPYADFVHGKQGYYLSDLVALSVYEVDLIVVEFVP